MRPVERPFVFVQWVDAVTRQGWEDFGELQRAAPEVVVSAGWMIERTRAQVGLASDVGRDDASTNRRIHIPMGMVDSITDREGRIIYQRTRKKPRDSAPSAPATS